MTDNNLVINNHYPIEYFTQHDIVQSTSSTNLFWSSTEKLPPEIDFLEVDLGRQRPLNFVDFEISYKPVNISIYYQVETTSSSAITESNLTLPVESTDGFLDFGTLLVNGEEISYLGKTATSFLIEIEETSITHEAITTTMIDLGDVMIDVDSTDGFSESGEIVVRNEEDGISYVLTYTSKTSTSFNGLTGGTSGIIVQPGAAVTQTKLTSTNTIGSLPIDTKIAQWLPVEPREDINYNLEINYISGQSNPWHYFDLQFYIITTRYIKIEFTRRPDPFPLMDSELFAWSVDVRNLRVMNAISSVSEYQEDTGEDILGNFYRTDLIDSTPASAIDGNLETYWQSQPNPASDAVEALYFDLRDLNSIVTVTQAYLNTLTQANLNGRPQSDMEEYPQEGIILDEIYVDPITTGPIMHVYYSNDVEAGFEDKMWTPVPRTFFLRKGFFRFPRSVNTRYLKLEFSRLSPVPYNTIDYPSLPFIRYRRYPTWVRNHFANLYSDQRDKNLIIDPVLRVTLDPLVLGFQTREDTIDKNQQELSTEITDQFVEETTSLLIEQIAEESTADPAQEAQEDEINFNSSNMFQTNLFTQLDNTRALSRFVRSREEDESSINAEITLDLLPLPTLQSREDLTEEREKKEFPIMWFPRTCRHGYQVVEVQRTEKLAYFVGIREVAFYRRDYTAPYDETMYSESFFDQLNESNNTFIQSGMRLEATS